MTENGTPPPLATFTSDDLREMMLRLAHEIRNPLATIKSSAQLVLRLEMATDAAQPYLESVVNQVTRIDQTVKEMERFARLEAGATRAVLVEEAATEAMEALRPRAEAAQIGFAPATGPTVRVVADPRLLRLALNELLDNAIIFSNPGAQVSLTWEKPEPGLVAIHVDDDGCGVRDDIAPRILQPFFSSHTHGIGLGLNVVQRIVLLLGGRLEWKNLPECGCRFTMVLRET